MNDRYADLAARALVHADDKPSVRELGDRSAIVAAMRETLVARAARQRRRSWALRAIVATSAAAVTLLGLRWSLQYGRWPKPDWRAGGVDAPAPIAIVAHPIGGGATMEGTPPSGQVRSHPGAPSSASSVRLLEGAALASGSRIVSSRDGRVDLAFSTGTRILVEEGADFAVLEQRATQMFRLDRGAMDADVAPLPVGGRFVLRTPDAEIEVHGTSFRVSVVPGSPQCGNSARTRVRVHSGQVVVRALRGEETLGPGESWPAGCDPICSDASDAPGSPAPPAEGSSAPLTAMPAVKTPVAEATQGGASTMSETAPLRHAPAARDPEAAKKQAAYERATETHVPRADEPDRPHNHDIDVHHPTKRAGVERTDGHGE